METEQLETAWAQLARLQRFAGCAFDAIAGGGVMHVHD